MTRERERERERETVMTPDLVTAAPGDQPGVPSCPELYELHKLDYASGLSVK